MTAGDFNWLKTLKFFFSYAWKIGRSESGTEVGGGEKRRQQKQKEGLIRIVLALQILLLILMIPMIPMLVLVLINAPCFCNALRRVCVIRARVLCACVHVKIPRFARCSIERFNQIWGSGVGRVGRYLALDSPGGIYLGLSIYIYLAGAGRFFFFFCLSL